MAERIIHDISPMAIVKVVVTLLALYFVWLIRDIISLLFVVLVIVAAFSPIIDRWSKKISRPLAISLLYVLVFLVTSVALGIILPPLINQTQQLAVNFPDYVRALLPSLDWSNQLLNISQATLAELAKQLSQLGSSIYSTTVSFLTATIAILTIIVLSFYLLLEEHGAKKMILEHLPLENRQRYANLMQKIGHKIGNWLRGQLILALIIGLISGIGLWLLGIKYVLVLAVWAGFTELIPYIGPIIGAVPAILIAFSISPISGFIVLVFYIVVQQVENQILVPKIMQKAVGLSPVIILLALLVGGKLAGILGIILAIPIAVTISVIFRDWQEFKKVASN